MNGPQVYGLNNFQLKKGCQCGGKCGKHGLHGPDAHGVTNTAPSGATRAQAFVSWVYNTRVRTAGGSYLGTSDLVEFVQQVHNMNIDVARQVLKYTTTPGLIYSIYQAGNGTKTQIEQRMATDPQFKQDVQSITKKVLNTGSEIWDTVTGPIKGISTTITWLPWIVIGGLAAFVLYAFLNPNSISTPRRISLT